MSYVAAAFIIALSCTVGAFGVYLTRRIFSSESLEKFNDVGGVVFLQVGVIYGVLLSFVAVLAWDQFAAASSAVELEAAELGTVYQLSKAIGSQRDQGVPDKVVKYLEAVIDDEWKEMKAGHESFKARQALNELWDSTIAIPPQSRHEEILYDEELDRLVSARESRRLRIFQINLAVPTFMWVLMISVGAIAVGLSCFFGIESLRSQMVLSASLAITVSFVLSLILMLDQPFSGDLTVSKEPFEHMLNSIKQQQSR